jgi:hypothetical protein
MTVELHRPVRDLYIEASIDDALSIRSFLTLTCANIVGLTAAYEYLCLAYVLADRYTNSEEHRRLQHDNVMRMAEDAARRFATTIGDDPSEVIAGLERQIDLSWRCYRRVRTGNRDSSELAREFVSHLTDGIPVDEEALAEFVQDSLLALPIGELIEECEQFGFD